MEDIKYAVMTIYKQEQDIDGIPVDKAIAYVSMPCKIVRKISQFNNEPSFFEIEFIKLGSNTFSIDFNNSINKNIIINHNLISNDIERTDDIALDLNEMFLKSISSKSFNETEYIDVIKKANREINQYQKEAFEYLQNIESKIKKLK